MRDVQTYPDIESDRSSRAVKPWEKWRCPRFKKDRCTVMILGSGSFLEEELEKNLKKMGHGVVRVRQENGEDIDSLVGRMMKGIAGARPDFLLTLNHLGFDSEGYVSEFFTSIDMPVASWFARSPKGILNFTRKSVSPGTALFFRDRSHRDDVSKMGFEKAYYLPAGTDEDTFGQIRLSRNRLKRFGCWIGFVGSSMMQRVRDAFEKFPEEFRSIVDDLADVMFRENMTFDEACEGFPEDDRRMVENLEPRHRNMLEMLSVHRATMLYRVSCLEKMEEFKPVIHGDRAWRDMLGNGWVVRPGPNHYREVPILYNATQINFNATSFQMPTAVNQRVLDVSACGSFLLTDYREAIEDLFEIGTEVIVYRHVDELPELIGYYRDNPDQREKIGHRARERVLKEHTYRHRLSFIVETMRKEFG